MRNAKTLIVPVMILIAAAMLLIGCSSGGDGASREELLRLAGATVQPTPQAQISATVTPDYQPALVAPTNAPEPMPVQSTAMPEQVQDMQVLAVVACNAMTPSPTRALSDADRAAGVVVAGAWPCEVQP